MRNFLFITFLILISCSKKDFKTEVIDINQKMTFEEFRVLIENNGNYMKCNQTNLKVRQDIHRSFRGNPSKSVSTCFENL